MKKLLILAAALLYITTNSFADDVYIDGNGNITAGSANSGSNFEVTGALYEDAIVGSSSGTGASGVYGINTDNNNYGILGHDNYGVYGNSSSGYAGYFDGNTRVTGNLTVDGSISATSTNADTLDGLDSTDFSLSIHNHDTTYINESQANSVTSSMITDGTIQQSDLSFTLGDGHSLDAADGSQVDAVYVDNSGNVGVGTTTPAGKLDVNGNICLGGVCRTTWPAGSGTGAFTDTGTIAYYNGASVGIGTSAPQGLIDTDSLVLHMLKPPALTGDTAVGLRLEIENKIDAGIMSGFNTGNNKGGLFVGTLSNHRLGLGTNGTEQVTLATNGDLTTKGNFGIKTPSPLQPLHVQGNAYVSGNLGIGVDSPANNLQVSGSNALMSSDTGDFRLLLSKNNSAGNAAIIFQDNYTGLAEIGLSGDNAFHFRVSADGTTFSDAMLIDHTNARVGMGLWPDSKLHVLSDNIDPAVIAESTGSSYAFMAWKKSDGDAVNIYKSTGSGNALFIFQGGTGPAISVKTATSDLFEIENNGNIGVATTSPTAKLDINGSTGYDQLRIRTPYTPTGTGDTNGNTGDISWDDNYLYIKTASGWKRAALTTF